MGDSKDDHRSSRRRDSRSRSPAPNRDSHSRRHRSRSRSPRRSSHRDKDRDNRRDRDRDRHDDERRERRRDKERERERDRDRDREDSGSESEVELPHGADQLCDDDYFLKATELKLWLWEEKGKKLDSLKTEDARRYFKKFCRAWNRGRLTDNYYAGISPSSLPSNISTSHAWSFGKASQADLDAAASIRKSIDTGTKTRSYDAGPAPRAIAGPSRGPQLGPAMPPSSAVERLQMERDARDSTREGERFAHASQRKRDARESRDEERDGRATGRDRLVEKRREGNASRREFERDREGGGMMEVSEDVLMGTGGFQDALRERDRAQGRREDRKRGKEEEKRAEMSDRLAAHKSKEDATMAMFKQMAAQRFGGGGA
ncbi:hypothetical protein JCM10207_005785 [Rhodosporidiobolus poonsookiae]